MATERMTRRRFLTKAAAAAAGLGALGLAVQCGGASEPEVAEVAATETPAWEAPERILFVGCGITAINLGVDTHLRELAASRDPPLAIETSRVRLDGAYLHHHAGGDTFALDEIRKGSWDVVVLQGSPAGPATEEQFSEAARKLHEEIKKVGAQTVFFMPWGLIGPHEGDPVGIRTLARGYENIGAELGARVAPVGLAAERSSQENPDLSPVGYWQNDLLPSMHGTYLAACVFYATLFGESPVGLSYAPEEISEEERAFLQRMAWETIEEYEQPAAD